MTRTVLIVDDDPGIQDILHIIFTNAGFQTTLHSTGDKILNNEFTPPDIFILDKQLAGIDGLDLCKQLKTTPHTEKIPVIMISATPGLRELSMEAGADDFIEKPFSIANLLDKVQRAMNDKMATDLH
jgi:DNA-binding response OmpR family regulator